MNIHFDKLTIIGVGLIGGSFARVCKKKGLAKSVVGFGRNEANLIKAVELGAIDKYSLSLENAVEQSDFILIAVPVGSIVPRVKDMLPFLKQGCIVSDVGSVKGNIINEIENLLPDNIHFVGAHPIAGTEKSGAENSFAELFGGTKSILTPTNRTDEKSLDVVKKIWEIMGSEVICMEADQHDKIMAAVSHFPHIAAFAMVSFMVELKNEWPDILSFSSGGFRDFTRIASSHPAMWRDISIHNRDALISMIEQYEKSLDRFKKLIIEEQWPVLEKTMSDAKNLRDDYYTAIDSERIAVK